MDEVCIRVYKLLDIVYKKIYLYIFYNSYLVYSYIRIIHETYLFLLYIYTYIEFLYHGRFGLNA